MDKEKKTINHKRLFDESLINELNGFEENGEEDKTESGETSVPPSTEQNNGKLFIIRVAAVAVAVVGIIMLVSGMVLHRLDEESRKTPAKAQMPEEYIEEFFTGENYEPDIEDYIEPEA